MPWISDCCNTLVDETNIKWCEICDGWVCCKCIYKSKEYPKGICPTCKDLLQKRMF